jgi:protein SCO1/2
MMRRLASRRGRAALGCALVLLAVLAVSARVTRQGGRASVETVASRNGRQQQYWPNGLLRSDITYREDAYEGEYRTYYESGQPYERRHYRNGHEQGLQQSWTKEGALYLNYEVRDGRRFGLVNATPCNAVGDDGAGRAGLTRPGQAPRTLSGTQAAGGSDASGLPYYDEPTFSPRWTPGFHRVSRFTLLTQTGASISDADLRGRPYVASFIYTSCAAVCPLLVGQLSRVQDAIRGTDARILSFSVTPDTDTPRALASFGRDHAIDSRTWALVTGNRRTIYRLARTAYFADDSRVGSGPDDDTAFLHTEKLILVDGEGRLRGVYNGTQPHAVDQLMADLGRLDGAPGR